MRILATLLMIVSAWLWSADDGFAGTSRVALVIGNSGYQHAPALSNPTNDAEGIAKSFVDLGFEVIKGIDLDKRAMERILQRFARALDQSKVGVFFYAGHGLQVSGRNYMVPIDARLDSSYSVDFELIRLDLVHRTMERATKTNILFVDACRDNPLVRNLARAMGTRSSRIGSGLATMEAGVGTLISFSTQPGNVALEGTGTNSPYAKALIKHFKSGRHNISDLLIRVRRDVMAETNRKQVPWEHTALTDQFYFRHQPTDQLGRQTRTANDQAEVVFWTSVKDTKDPALIRAYLGRYPKGIFASIAHILVNKMDKRSEKTALARIKQEELRVAEEKKQKAKAARRAAERRQALAKQAEELQQSRQEAERAREALKVAEQERLAAIKAAKKARKAREEAEREVRVAKATHAARAKVVELEVIRAAPTPAKSDSSAKLASLPAPVAATLPPAKDYGRDVQAVLKKLGCYTGKIDGIWGRVSRAALARAIGRVQSRQSPSRRLVDRLRKLNRSVCAREPQIQKSKPKSTVQKKPANQKRVTRPKNAGGNWKKIAHFYSWRRWPVPNERTARSYRSAIKRIQRYCGRKQTQVSCQQMGYQ